MVGATGPGLSSLVRGSPWLHMVATVPGSRGDDRAPSCACSRRGDTDIWGGSQLTSPPPTSSKEHSCCLERLCLGRFVPSVGRVFCAPGMSWTSAGWRRQEVPSPQTCTCSGRWLLQVGGWLGYWPGHWLDCGPGLPWWHLVCLPGTGTGLHRERYLQHCWLLRWLSSRLHLSLPL